MIPKLSKSLFAVVADAQEVDAVLGREHLETLLPVLKNTSSSHPRLHSLWGVLLSLLVPGTTLSACAQLSKVLHTLSSTPTIYSTRVTWNLGIAIVFI